MRSRLLVDNALGVNAHDVKYHSSAQRFPGNALQKGCTGVLACMGEPHALHVRNGAGAEN